MKNSITFLGASRNVTGSKYLVELNGSRFLVDCGLFQEYGLKDRNWDPLPIAPTEIDYVLLTHAHLDHCGLLPKLVKDGFKGTIYGTPATIEIARIVLLDSGSLQEEDARFKRKRHKRENRKPKFPETPLYTREDAEATFSQFSPVECEQPLRLANGITATFYEAGHILGSTSIKVGFPSGEKEETILFSGDIGRKETPILRDPTQFDAADYVVMESTYGDKKTAYSPKDFHSTLSEIINDTKSKGGNVIIPSFAIERSQEVLYRLSELLAKKLIPPFMVFMDSPMAIRVTEVFRKYPQLFDKEAVKLLESGRHPCDFPGLQMCKTTDQSKAINQIRGSSIIIAGSGMCTGGRIKHHLKNNITRPECTILFVGYQAIGTLGRQIVDGAEMVRILGQHYPVKAKIVKIDGFSAHADRGGLLDWISSFKSNLPKKLFLTHGEEDASKSLATLIQRRFKVPITRPSYKDRLILE